MKKEKPKLIETKDGWKVTDGWIGDFYCKVEKQPSEATLRKLNMFFLKVAELNIKESNMQEAM